MLTVTVALDITLVVPVKVVLVVVTAVAVVLVLVVVVVVVTVVVRAPVCAEALIGTFVEVLIVNEPIIVSSVAVNLLMDALISMMLDVLTSIDVGVLVDLNVNVLPRAMTAFEFAVPEPFEGFRCCAAFDCRPMAALDCVSVLQAWMPSYQV